MASIPFAGGGDALQALLSGTVQISSGVLAPAHPHVKAGIVFETYLALMAPSKTPPEIVKTLEKTCLDILAKPEMREKLAQSGFQVQAKTGADHMARVAREIPMFRDIIKQAGIKQL